MADEFSSEVDDAIARNIRTTRERFGLSQTELARMLTDGGLPNMHQTTIARIESGQRTVRLAEAVAIARVLELRVEDLVESAQSAALRADYQYLREGWEAYSAALSDLLYRRVMIAQRLDEEMPYSSEGKSITPEYLSVDPSRYNLLDELLSSNSAPEMALWFAYDGIRKDLLSKEPPTPFVNSRLMEILEEAEELALTALKIRDFSHLPDSDFRREVLDRFDPDASS